MKINGDKVFYLYIARLISQVTVRSKDFNYLPTVHVTKFCFDFVDEIQSLCVIFETRVNVLDFHSNHPAVIITIFTHNLLPSGLVAQSKDDQIRRSWVRYSPRFNCFLPCVVFHFRLTKDNAH